MNEILRNKLWHIHNTINAHETKSGLILIKQLLADHKDDDDDEPDDNFVKILRDEYTALKVYKDHHVRAIASAQWIREFADDLGLVMTDDLSIEGVARMERQYRMLNEAVMETGKPKPELEAPDERDQILKDLISCLVQQLNFPGVRTQTSGMQLKRLDEIKERVKKL